MKHHSYIHNLILIILCCCLAIGDVAYASSPDTQGVPLNLNLPAETTTAADTTAADAAASTEETAPAAETEAVTETAADAAADAADSTDGAAADTGSDTGAGAATIPVNVIPAGTDKYADKGGVIEEDGLLVAGVVCIMIEHPDAIANATPVKSWGEIDWEKRGSVLEGYENFGLSVVGSYLNVRKSASEDADIIGKMTNLNVCDIVSKSNDGKWYKIKSGNVTGWVSSEYIMTGWEAKDKAREEAYLMVKIKTETINVRGLPSEDSQIWTQANGNELYDVVRELDDWVEIELDTSTGYVSRQYVDVGYYLNTAVKVEQTAEAKATSLRDRIVNYALKWIGTRYVWGGESLSKGCDCSGFTKKVYEYFGYGLTHYSGTQAYEGTKISRSQLKKGDLVFYAKSGTINHVMMYIGNGQVVGARSARRGVCIASLDYRTPVRYVRVVND